jgi:hypothetical protein
VESTVRESARHGARGGEAAGADYGPKRKRLTGQGDTGEPVDLDWYRRTGHLVQEGKLADDSVIVVITPYTQGRMTLRDVDDTEYSRFSPNLGVRMGQERPAGDMKSRA